MNKEVLMTKLGKEKLNQLYLDSTNADRDIFAEMRSNILLVAGDHYTKKTDKNFVRLRETNRLTDGSRLRLTKNHIHRISRHYVNAIMNGAGDVAIGPNNPKQMQDRKSAELNKKVWDWSKRKNKLKQDIKKWAKSYIDIGEVAVKVFWNPYGGDFVGYEQAVDEENDPIFNSEGEPEADKDKPIFTGALEIEELAGYNIFRDPNTRDIEKSKYIGIRKMVDLDLLKSRYKDDAKKYKAVKDATGQEFIVFDSNRTSYSKNSKQVLVKEVYYRPCKDYPNGYFYIFTSAGILEHGELPYGKFPILIKPFDRYSSSPRGRSVIKVARPYQAEINRAASMAATQQITLGQDKILYQAGSKLSPGALLPGVRGISYQGASPQILPGRNGSQYFEYIQMKVQELYSAVMLPELYEKSDMQVDAYKLLHMSASKKAKFKVYIDNFEEFMVDLVKLYLDLAKNYYSDEQIMEAVGGDEYGNISEFRNSAPQDSQIQAEPQSDSVDTLLGRQMTFDHLLQYAGGQLNRDDIGKFMANMPFMNNKEIFSDFTQEHENAENDMLALERGEIPQISPSDDNEYHSKKLNNRMRKADFMYLAPQVQQAYQQLASQHEAEIQRKRHARKQAENDYIPTDGALITCSMQIPDGEGKSKQLRLPYASLMFLVKQLESQGADQATLDNMNQGALANMIQEYQSSQQPIGQPQALPQIPPVAQGGF